MTALWNRLANLEKRFEDLAREVAGLRAYVRTLEERIRTISRAG